MAAQLNRYPLWKYILIVVVMIASFIYAMPNLYGEYYAVQIMGANGAIVDTKVQEQATAALKSADIPIHDEQFQGQTLLIRFNTTDAQLKAKGLIQATLGDQYIVALNLSPATPKWLKSLNAMPMKLGLDLRGGVHFLLQVDVESVMKQRVEGDLRGMGQAMRDERIRYAGITRKSDQAVELLFRSEDAAAKAFSFVTSHYPEFKWTKQSSGNDFILNGVLSPAALLGWCTSCIGSVGGRDKEVGNLFEHSLNLN